ncbi:diguanylate cyclase [Vibrio albus]|uniref:Diguanylate cyclase n=1 Tax=Vibrio albus TaxID=2200953 RepID=A0A2U3BBX8_9VIBR|nr:DEAD/DEAH box helicase family protein [Vibrio albus]PWI34234.1 diguanylate cyclase [Vibrio albus]
MLRAWQKECVELALEKYLSGQEHFLSQATPGAGKTVMAAELASQLFELDEIDLVLCFSPSLSVAENMKETFAWKLNCVFDGTLGAIGGSYTYQSLKFLGQGYWKAVSKYRILVVFDEIHHCSADDDGRMNVWGEQIISNIQSRAKYTLALTGTPWRSDSVPIAMAKYTDPEGHIICDYQYSLSQAVRDKVCRSPKLVLVDNDHLTVKERGETKSFSSIFELLKQSSASYQQVIHNPQAIRYILSLACDKLSAIRTINPNAGGLIVAASVKHAEYIQKLLVEEFGQTAALVTYQHDSPLKIIDQFRNDSSQWIVSVGMISEGTDIPRLQVCCHLSAVKTELYFRQVLGRILRVNDSLNQEAWLYTFAEENLVGFAERIEQDIPETCQFVRFTDKESKADIPAIELKSNRLVESNSSKSAIPSSALVWNSTLPSVDTDAGRLSERDLLSLGQFRQRVIAAFL